MQPCVSIDMSTTLLMSFSERERELEDAISLHWICPSDDVLMRAFLCDI